jgi:hypothetical protein
MRRALGERTLSRHQQSRQEGRRHEGDVSRGRRGQEGTPLSDPATSSRLVFALLAGRQLQPLLSQ